MNTMTDELPEKNLYDRLDAWILSLFPSSELVKTDTPKWSRRFASVCWYLMIVCVALFAIVLVWPEVSYQGIYGERNITDVRFFNQNFDTYADFAAALKQCHNRPITPDLYQHLKGVLTDVLAQNKRNFICTTMHSNDITLPCACLLHWNDDTLFLVHPNKTNVVSYTHGKATIRVDFVSDDRSKYQHFDSLPIAMHIQYRDESANLCNLSVFERDVAMFTLILDLLVLEK